jgi:hypothetical protein
MQSPVQMLRRNDIDLPDVELSELELPKLDLSKVEIPKVDVSKVDLGKAVGEAAIAVGLAKPRRPRWQWALGALVVATVGAIVIANADAILTRLGRVRDQFAEQVSSMRAGGMETEPAAFTAAETKPIQEPSMDPLPSSTSADYPAGLGADAMVATNGREKVPSNR